MKGFFKVLKLIVATLLCLYSAIIIYMLAFSKSEDRYSFAAHSQGYYLSQTMFEILKFQEPTNDMIYFEQSVPFNKRGDYNKGFEFLDKAVALAPVEHMGYRGYIKLRFQRDFEGALKDFEELDSLTPGVIDTPWGEDIDFLRGEAYYGKKEFELAREYFQKSIENQGPEWADIQAFVYLGHCETELGNSTEAIEYYQMALEQSKYTVEAHLGLAKSYLLLNDKDFADQHLKLAEKFFNYKRNDPYNEYLNEVYISDLDKVSLSE